MCFIRGTSFASPAFPLPAVEGQWVVGICDCICICIFVCICICICVWSCLIRGASPAFPRPAVVGQWVLRRQLESTCPSYFLPLKSDYHSDFFVRLLFGFFSDSNYLFLNSSNSISCGSVSVSLPAGEHLSLFLPSPSSDYHSEFFRISFRFLSESNSISPEHQLYF